MSLAQIFKNAFKKHVKETSVTIDVQEGRGGQCLRQSFFGVSKITLTTYELKKSPIGTIRTGGKDTSYAIGPGKFQKQCAKLDKWTKSDPYA